jgi:hypothetical protein
MSRPLWALLYQEIVMRIGQIPPTYVSPRRPIVPGTSIVGLDAVRSLGAGLPVPSVRPSPSQDAAPLANDMARMLATRASQRAQVGFFLRNIKGNRIAQSAFANMTEWDIDYDDVLARIKVLTASPNGGGLRQAPLPQAPQSELLGSEKPASAQASEASAESPDKQPSAASAPRFSDKTAHTRLTAYRSQTRTLRRHADVVPNAKLDQELGEMGAGFTRAQANMVIPMLVGFSQSIAFDPAGAASHAASQTKHLGPVSFRIPAFQGQTTGAYSGSMGTAAA